MIVFWKQSCPVRFLTTALRLPCISPGAHRITPRHICGSGETESSRVNGFSNSQLVLLTAASFPGPPIPAANSLLLPEATLLPLAQRLSVPSSFRIQINSHPPGTQSPCLAPAPSSLSSHVPLCLFAKPNELCSHHVPVCYPRQESLPSPLQNEVTPSFKS